MKITYDEMVLCLSSCNLNYENPTQIQEFLEVFRIQTDFVPSFYDFSSILLLLILFCKNKFLQKFELIFDLFDEDKDEYLTQKQVKDVYVKILHTVFQFSLEILVNKNILEKDSEIYELFVQKTEETVTFYKIFQ